jgi:hypothetical protein
MSKGLCDTAFSGVLIVWILIAVYILIIAHCIGKLLLKK